MTPTDLAFQRCILPDCGATYGIDEVRVALPISQTELASWVGSSREAVVKALRTLRSQGCIETARGEVRIQDAARLGRYASA